RDTTQEIFCCLSDSVRVGEPPTPKMLANFFRSRTAQYQSTSCVDPSNIVDMLISFSRRPSRRAPVTNQVLAHGRYFCSHPSCPQSFTRRADAKRHNTAIHE